MSQEAQSQAPQPTRSMAPFDVLIGTWTMVGRHPQIPDAVHGTSTFEWLRDGALLAWHFDWEPGQVPSAYNIIGHDDTIEACTMLYTDTRGVARILQMTLADGVWKQWRDSPDFAQHMTATFSADGKTIEWRGELSKDGGATWEEDLSVTFTRQS